MDPEGAAPSTATNDDIDVPAAVICAVCGRADCGGCSRRAPHPGGPVRTPWEERGSPFFRRLWGTARATTLDGEAFFGDLPEGTLGSALAFAVACELCAVASLTLLWFPIAYAFVPEVIGPLVVDETRNLLLVTFVAVVPALSLLMVALHLLWASGLELGMRLGGGPPRAAHSARYALYSCGWDLVTSPFGFLAGLVEGGPSGAAAELRAALRIPRLATRAYLSRSRSIPLNAQSKALVTAVLVTGSAVLAGALALGVALVIMLA